MPNYLITYNFNDNTADFDNIVDKENIPKALKSLYFITINYVTILKTFCW
jgi:hypothetical protein